MSKWLNTTHIQQGKKNGLWNDFYKWLLKDNKPCHFLSFCPYGQLVEEFPICEEESAYAIKHGKYVKWSNPKGFPAEGTWVSCKKGDKGASPDVNWAAGKVKAPYSCKVFGHNCPVFYHAEPMSEVKVKGKWVGYIPEKKKEGK